MARRGFSPAGFGRVLAVNGLLIAAVQPWAAPVARRFDPSRVLAAASVLVIWAMTKRWRRRELDEGDIPYGPRESVGDLAGSPGGGS